MQDAIIKEIAAIVGQENLLAQEEDRWTYAYDATDLTALPDLVVFPGSAAEISAIVKLANQYRFPVVPRGEETIRFQVNAAHTAADIQSVLKALADFRGSIRGGNL